MGGIYFLSMDFLTSQQPLLVLNCKVVLFKSGEMELDDYSRENNIQKDILSKIVLKKEDIKSMFFYY